MTHDTPDTHLGIAAVATCVGGIATLGVVAIAGSAWSLLFLLPWLLGAIGLYHAIRGAMLPRGSHQDIEDRGKRALHFSIFSLSISGIFVVIVLFGILLFVRGG